MRWQPFMRHEQTAEGWKTQADGEGASYPSNYNFRMPDEDTTLYAIYEEIVVEPTGNTLTFYENGGSAVADQTLLPGEVINLPKTTHPDYEFVGWEDEDGNIYEAGDPFTMPDHEVTLKAVWASNEYKLYFDTNKPAGAISDPECEKSFSNVLFSEKLGQLPSASVIGYDFVGWFTADGAEYTADTVYNVVGDTVVYAKWTVNTYNIITDANAGNDIADGTYTIENGVIPAGGTRTGYTFSHWEVAADAGNWVAGQTYNAGDAVKGKYGDVTLKAIWTANKYTVNFNLNDANSVSSATATKSQMTVEYDSSFNKIEDMPSATRAGYKFLGWYTEPVDGTKIEITDVYTTADDTTLYAQWEVINYKIKFDGTGIGLVPIGYPGE